jgi:hypothetical protein
MAINYFLLRNDELAVVAEADYGVSAGDPVAGDFFKSESSRVDFSREQEVFKRDSDRDYGKGSVTEMHVGRRKSGFTIKGRVVPSGNAVTPTAPDQDVLYEKGIGAKHTATAHTVTAAGSVGTTLELTAGGGAASGMQAGDLIGVDVSDAIGIEVRRVISIATIAAVSATATIGSGANGTVTIEVDVAGEAGNDYTVEVVVAVGNNQPLAAALVGDDLTVTLATDGDGNPDNAANTATLVAAEINASEGATFTATPSGTGAGWLNDAEAQKNFAGGVDAPPGDTVVIDRALTADPVAARDVYVGTTYTLSEAALGSAHLWLFNGDNLRFKVPGAIVNEVALDINLADGAPTAGISFKGEGQPRAAQVVAKPTATTAGSVEVPDVGHAWIGAEKVPLVNASLSIKNGLKLRNREGDALYPTGVNRLDNKSRYMVEQTLEMYLTSGDRDVETLDAGADTMTELDVIVQLGNAAGKIVAWCTPAWRPSGENTDQDGEIGLKLAGECFGTSGDDNVYLAFL